MSEPKDESMSIFDCPKFCIGCASGNDLPEGEQCAMCGRIGPPIHGHLTLRDGSHIPLTKDEAKSLWLDVERKLKERAARLPDEQSAIRAMFDVFDRLRELGWRDVIYCPKDGSSFQVIEAGSTGIHRCHYDGEWPDGCWWIEEDGDMCPSRPILFRLYQDAAAVEQTAPPPNPQETEV